MLNFVVTFDFSIQFCADDEEDESEKEEDEEKDDVEKDDEEQEGDAETETTKADPADALSDSEAETPPQVEAVAEVAKSDSEEPPSRSSTPCLDENNSEIKAENGTKEVEDKASSKSTDDDMTDIEQSIPTAILVQKANNNDETVVEVNNQIGGVDVSVDDSPVAVKHDENETTEQSDAVVKQESEPNCDIKPKLENGNIGSFDEVQGVKTEPMDVVALADEQDPPAPPAVVMKSEDSLSDVVEIKPDIKDEIIDVDAIIDDEMAIDKWFSIVSREIQLSSAETDIPLTSQSAYANLTCDLILQFQGNRWDIGNNAHHFHVPTEPAPLNISFNRESILSLSGLCEDMMASVLKGETNNVRETCADDDLETKSDGNKSDDIQPFQLPTFLNNSLGNISTFIQCDNPPPLQMTPEEQEMLDNVKINGLPQRRERNFVRLDLRYGWWKINDVERLNNLLQSLNNAGVRERDLRINLLNTLTDSVDLSTQCHVGDPESPPPDKGFIDPEPFSKWLPQVAHRVEVALLDQVEALEDKIAGASMQVKGWAAPSRDTETENDIEMETGIALIRERILDLESAIERRYLKPPLGTR